MVLRALDHIVWPTRDLDALAATFQRLGFTVGRRNRHPWGTVNHIVQFDGCFLELLGFAEDYRPVATDDLVHPFAGFCEDFLESSPEGAAMLVLRSDDAATDAALFREHGLGEGRLLPFSRAAQGPDGSDRTVAFTVAFADLPGLPEIGAFTCQQHRPENFWNPDAQRHANGALGISRVSIVTPDIVAAEATLARFAGGGQAGAPGDSHSVPLTNSVLKVGAVARGGGTTRDRSRIAELHIGVRDPTMLRDDLDRAGIAFSEEGAQQCVVVEHAGGTNLVFGAVSS